MGSIKMETVDCPACGYEQEFDPDNDTVQCDGCDVLLDVYELNGEWLANEI